MVARIRLDDHSPTASDYEPLGRIPLQRGESRESFVRLRDKIHFLLQPQNILERDEVQTIALKIWEAARLKQFQNTMLDSPWLLSEMLKIIFDDDELKAQNTAVKYFSPDQKESDDAFRLIEESGITEKQIQTRALTLQIDEFKILDQLVQYRELSKNRVIKRAMKRLAKRKRARSLKEDAAREESAPTKRCGTVLPLKSTRRNGGD